MHRFATPLFLTQLTSTLFLTGLIWFVQIVHYPLFAAVGPGDFPAYARAHATRTGWVVAVPMLLELGTALLALTPVLRPGAMSRTAAVLSAVLVLLIWLSTALVQIPLHNHLAAVQDLPAIRRLVLTNWLRTMAWSARSVLLLATLVHLIER